MKPKPILLILMLLTACSTTSVGGNILIPTTKGKCLRYTDIGVAKAKTECLESSVKVSVSFRQKVDRETINNVMCSATSPVGSITFKPPATLRIPLSRRSNKPFFVKCTSGKYAGAAFQRTTALEFYDIDRQPTGFTGYFFGNKHMRIPLK